MIKPSIHAIGGSEEDNPYSESEVILSSHVDQDVIVGLGHSNAQKSYLDIRFAAISVTDTSDLRILLSENMTVYRVGHDMNRDGTVDAWHYPDGTVVGVLEDLIPQSLQYLNACPNPFNPTTTISYELPESAVVNLSVYDVSGRLVRVLVGSESLSAGPHEVVWNGQEDGGRQVATGVYFYRLETPEYAETRRITLIK